MTTPDDARAELPRDDHLLAALRHAPDHALTPPSHVTQAILAAAEQVHRAPVPAAASPAPVRAQPERHLSLAERLQLLLAPRWAGSVAAGLVAALVVGLWYEEDLPAPVITDRVASQAQTQKQAQTQGETRTAAPAPPTPTPAATTPPVPAPVPATPPPIAAAPAKVTRRVEADNKAAASPRSDTAKRVTESEPAAPAAAAQAATTAPAPAAAPAPAPAPQVAATRDERAAGIAQPAPRAEAAAPKPAEAPRRAESAAAATSSGAGDVRDSAPAAGAMRLAPGLSAGVAAASPALTLLRRARAETDARTAIWTWQPGAGTTARSFDADAQEWLQRLVYAARGRWVDVAERSDGGVATELLWWRDDEPVAALRIEAQGLRWTEPSSRIRFAPMTADELARLGPP